MLEQFCSILQRALSQAHRVCICGHTKPDLDALGSAYALKAILESNYPQLMVDILLADNVLPTVCTDLLDVNQLKTPQYYKAKPDIFISVDVPCVARLHAACDTLKKSKEVFCIDHHPGDHDISSLQYVDHTASATAVLIYRIARHLHLHINKLAAQAILLGVMTDTGSFQYQNVNRECFEIAAYCVEQGVNVSVLAQSVYQSKSLAQLKLQARVIENLVHSDVAPIAVSYLTIADIIDCSATDDDADNMVDYIRQLKSVKLCAFLKEHDKGIRVNLRAKDLFDVSGIARSLGGGGHRAAAGAPMSGDMTAAVDYIFNQLEQCYEQSVE